MTPKQRASRKLPKKLERVHKFRVAPCSPQWFVAIAIVMKKALVILTTLLAGCATAVPEKDALFGTWRSDARTLELHADGTFRSGKLTGCWERKGNVINFMWPCIQGIGNVKGGHRCEYSMSPGILTLKDCLGQGEYQRETRAPATRSDRGLPNGQRLLPRLGFWTSRLSKGAQTTTG
jgi:hypothetical protein